MFTIARLDGKRVLITGGQGFLGSRLAECCLGLGARVTVFAHHAPIEKPQPDQYTIAHREPEAHHGTPASGFVISGDIRDAALVRSAIAGNDIVFHLAAQTSNRQSLEDPLLDVDINCSGTLNVLEACRDAKATLVFASTIAAIGRPVSLPVAELQQARPLSVYDANKLACEYYIRIYHRRYGLAASALRLSNVFGEGRPGRPDRGILNQMILKALQGQPLTAYGDGSFVRDYNYIENIVDAFLLAAQSPTAAGRVFAVGSGRGIRFIDLLKTVNDTTRRLAGKSGPITHVPFPPAAKMLDLGDVVVDASAFRSATGWEPRVTVEEGLERTVRFCAQQLQLLSTPETGQGEPRHAMKGARQPSADPGRSRANV